VDEPAQVFPLILHPAIQRDGTALDVNKPTFIDSEWCRFQRGRPRKMGGYIRITDKLLGPVRKVLVTPYDGSARILTFSSRGIEAVVVDSNGLGAHKLDRTPSGFAHASGLVWSVAEMYDDAAGSQEALVLGVAADALSSIDTSNVGQVYYGNTFDETEFTEASGITCRGLLVSQPYAIYYGHNGIVTWSNANEPLNISTGDAGSDRVTALTIVAGLPLPTGTGAGALLWSLDSVLRMEYIGGQQIFRFTHITKSSSILSQNAVIEFDGVYYWIGEDRFFVSDGASATELPNDTNLNFFFDNINRDHKTKVWADRNRRFGEVVWYYPRGENTECSHAIVYNVRTKEWSDFALSRTAGAHYYNRPVSTSSPNTREVRFTVENLVGDILVGDVLSFDLSATKIRVTLIDGETYYGSQIIDGVFPQPGMVIDNTTRSGTADVLSYSETCALYIHEFGVDAINGDHQLAIQSSVTTSDISLLSTSGLNRWTRLIRVEPDFIVSNDISMYVITKEFALSEEVIHGPYTITPTTEKVDLRIQGRHIFLKFVSDVFGGDFQFGRCLLHIEPGDIRS